MTAKVNVINKYEACSVNIDRLELLMKLASFNNNDESLFTFPFIHFCSNLRSRMLLNGSVISEMPINNELHN